MVTLCLDPLEQAEAHTCFDLPLVTLAALAEAVTRECCDYAAGNSAQQHLPRAAAAWTDKQSVADSVEPSRKFDSA